ncbi:MAG: PDZ domain-containing protein [Verrucomicrobia bacterium]|nr:PDZ domain-containing protein [Verrucomicrobiota bacterium]
MKRRCATSLLLACWLGAGVALTAERDGTVNMEPVRVSSIWTNAVVRVVMQQSNDGPRISVLRVESVRENSAAARAGLAKGMEIVAIQGVALAGLTEEEYQRVMITPVVDVFVLRVRREGRVRTEEIRVAMGK